MAEILARRYDADADNAPLVIGDVMVALGDSIAAGIGAGHVAEGCMWLLADRLRRLQPPLDFHFLAVPSETSASMLAPGGQLDRAERVIDTAVAEGSVVGPVTLSVGGNDIMEAALIGDDEALLQLEGNLDAMLRRLDVALWRGGQRLDEVAVVQTVYNPFEALPPDSAHTMAPHRASRSGYNAAIRRVAQNHGVRVCDVASLFRGRTLDLTWVRTGDIHPTGEGHELIAAEYLRTAEGIDAALQSFDDTIGLDRLVAIHANDSRAEFQSNVDRHANIGDGFLGEEAFALMLNDPRLRDHPWILEVPGLEKRGPDLHNVNKLRELAGLEPARPPEGAVVGPR